MTLSPHLIPRFEQELRLRNYRPNTIKTYLTALRAYLRWLDGMPPREATPETLGAYLHALFEAGRSRSYVDQAISALKFLYIDLYRAFPSFRIHSPDGISRPRPRRVTTTPTPGSRPLARGARRGE